MALRPLFPISGESGAYTGFLSTYAEWHALSIGLAIGILIVLAASDESDHLDDAWSEFSYTLAGFTAAVVIWRAIRVQKDCTDSP